MKDKTPKYHKARMIIAFIGLLDATYLLIIKLTNNQDLCPKGIGDCWSVNNSSYSELYGIPVSAFGIATYLTLIVLMQWERKYKFWRKNSILFQFGITLVGFLFSIYLTYVQFGILHKICPFCLVSALTMTTMFILTTIRLIKTQAFES
jgi:uncharacterized membrane protein